jgi:uncharacterized alkaline shock family protein YloU
MAQEKNTNERYSEAVDIGTVKIADDVVALIAAFAAMEVEGVSGLMTNMAGSVTELFGKKATQKTGKSVKLELTDEALNLDLYITVKYGHAIPEVAENA